MRTLLYTSNIKGVEKFERSGAILFFSFCDGKFVGNFLDFYRRNNKREAVFIVLTQTNARSDSR